jgi:hypothetical protein
LFSVIGLLFLLASEIIPREGGGGGAGGINDPNNVYACK